MPASDTPAQLSRCCYRAHCQQRTVCARGACSAPEPGELRTSDSRMTAPGTTMSVPPTKAMRCCCCCCRCCGVGDSGGARPAAAAPAP
eukprot:scaffold350_cov313-Prasinococcus_capsulatus_cf.AAC.6